ncbi:MAG: TPM domain-containing protein [Bacteroidota bacterium]
MLRRLPVLLLALVLALPASGQGGPGYEAAFDVPPRPSPPRLVNDDTSTLAAAERDALERKLVAFDDSTGSQIAVVIVASTNGVAPVDYATEILRSWGVGRADVNDGVVVLVATEDREVFIATGFGAEGALTDATAGTIVRSIIVPNFRQGSFYAGLDGATSAIMSALAGEFEAPTARRPTSGGGGLEIGSVMCLLLVVFLILVVLSSRAGPPPPSSGGGWPRGGRRRGPGVIVVPSFGGGGFGSGGGFGGGFGGGGFGGGFGGFGGGFGGGGGAGGSW